MAKASPLQQVRERFGSKEELAKQLYGKLERIYEGETDEEYERRIRTTSNIKLLRLHSVVEEVESRFGGKSGLVDAIVKLRAGEHKPDEQYRGKLETYQQTRLLDLHRSLERRAKRA